MKFKITIYFLCLLFIVGCQTEAKSINNKLSDKINYIESNNHKLSDEEWNKDQKEIDKLIIKYENLRDQFSRQEREEINKLIGKYHAIATKRLINETKSEFEDLSQRVEGFIDEFEKE